MTSTKTERKPTPETSPLSRPTTRTSSGSARRAPKAITETKSSERPPEVPAGFNLRTLIREQLATQEPDPHVIAERVAKLVPESELRAALAQVLPDFVRKMDVEARPDSPGHPIHEAHPSGASADRSSTNGKPRSRWDDAGPWYKRLLARREYIDGTWKFFADLTPDDLDAAALLRETHAERTAEEGRKFRRVAELARERGAKTVRALPAEVLAEVWQ